MRPAFYQNLDKLGLASSFFCAIHCAVTPLIMSLFLTMGAHKFFLHGWEHLDLICLLIAPCLASLTLKDGYCKHQSKLPALIFLTGFVVILFGYYVANQAWHPLFMACGGITIALAHFLNIKLLSSFKTADGAHVCINASCNEQKALHVV
jgi:hypothetical protein